MIGHSRRLIGRTISLVIGRYPDGTLRLSEGIHWYVYGCGGGYLWLRTMSSRHTKSKLLLSELETQVQDRRLVLSDLVTGG